MPLEVIILAAGQGKRMRSKLPKVLHCIGGKPMLQHLLETTRKLKPLRTHVVVGYGKDLVIQTISENLGISQRNKEINWVEQSELRGTGHAVIQVLPYIKASSTVLILNGDTPLVEARTLRRVAKSDNRLNLLTISLSDPTGMGRILRSTDGEITGIVEEKDATPKQKRLLEVNTNCMGVKVKFLKIWLQSLQCDNAQGEYYLTDSIACAVKDGIQVNGISTKTLSETLGVNSKSDLHKLERLYQTRAAAKLMASGVTLMDSSRIDIRGTCRFGNDCVIDINVILEGDVKIGSDVKIGPNCLIRNTTIGTGCIIEANCVIDHAVIGRNCNIGPFARIRPETVLKNEVRIGNFVEIKKSVIEERSKVNHLSYVGDSNVGKEVNIGAGVITCNYDGANKHKTIIGDNVFVGSDAQLIAPVEIGAGATIGAGSTITDDVKKHALAVNRSRQRSIANWERPSKKSKT